MIRHVALLTFADGTTAAEMQAIQGALSALPGLIPELRSYEIGPDLAIAPGNASFGVVADCATIDDYIVYRDHPEHQRIIAEMIAPKMIARTAVQYEFD